MLRGLMDGIGDSMPLTRLAISSSHACKTRVVMALIPFEGATVRLSRQRPRDRAGHHLYGFQHSGHGVPGQGIHVGDIIIEENDIFGDGVNIAVRLEEIAEPGGVSISDDAHRQIRGKIGIDYDDMGPHVLKNIVEPMRVWRVRLNGLAAPPVPNHRSAGDTELLALPDRPSIAVLPFENMSGDPEQEYFADGIVDDITTALSRFKLLFVIARNSSFVYKGKAVDIKQVGRELGVRYVLEGSVRKEGNRVRITGQLIDSITGSHLWADRFEGELADLFDLQDKVTESVVGAIVPELQQAEIQRARRKPTESLDAYDFFLRGMAREVADLAGGLNSRPAMGPARR